MQLPLPLQSSDGAPEDASKLALASFSHNDVSPQSARLALEARYTPLLKTAHGFDRRLVSYQGNKGAILHSWIKYREGFSAQLVEGLLHEFGIEPSQKIFEPFSGSATTLLVAKSLGIDAVGLEILPVCHLAWSAKSFVFDYDLHELERVLRLIHDSDPGQSETSFPHLIITQSAFPPQAERELMFYTEWFDSLSLSSPARTLLRLVLTSILEEISYTRKDGQYLRWDNRAAKLQARQQIRRTQGKPEISGLDKGGLPTVKQALLTALRAIMEDVRELQARPCQRSKQTLIRGSALTVLPTFEQDQFDAVITSPPYCNRYDYTRTYALELAYLGIGEDGIRSLRQSQLSCTVENRSKLDLLESTYTSQGQSERFRGILNVVQQNAAFQEINDALKIRWNRGEINNRGILSMVEGYFIELTFVFAEILRTCRSGAHVAFVNDNVRYGGEVIPVDFLTTELAEQLGFVPVKVHVLPERKGNSSQQMGKFGRQPLRKSITIWRTP